jgi:uncharacterized protein (DUF58 family)
MWWLIAAIVLFATAWALQAGLIVYAAVTLGLMVVINRWLAGDGLQHVSAQREIASNELNVGDSIEVTVRVRHDGRRPLVWLLMEDLLPEAALQQRPPRVVVKGRRLRVRSLRPGATAKLSYRVTFQQRGVYPIGPTVLETGDLFGFFRRYKVVAPPKFVTVLPKVAPLVGYEIASRRPIGDIRMAHRLYEDPTRIAGVRAYEPNDPLNRIHWKATARTGRLHTKVIEPSCLAGTTLLIDHHVDAYPPRGEPYRSELMATTAASLAHAVLLLHQPVGLWSNGMDGAAKWDLETMEHLRRAEHVLLDEEQFRLAEEARHAAQNLRAAAIGGFLGVATRRGWDQLPVIRQLLARLEPSGSRPLGDFLLEVAQRLPRDTTALVLTPQVDERSALALGNLRRQGFAVAVILVLPVPESTEAMVGRLAAEGIRDVRVLNSEAELPDVCQMRSLPSVVPLGA